MRPLNGTMIIRTAMYSALNLLTFFALLTFTTNAQERTVTNQASGRAEIAPEAMAVIAGLNLNVIAKSAPSIRNLPHILADTRVEVEGRSAGLRFVSRREIVFMVPKMPVRFARTRVTVTVIAPGEQIQIEVAFAHTSPGLLCYGQPREDCKPQAIYRFGAGAPYLVQDWPISLSTPGADAVVQFIGTGFRRANLRQAEMNLCGETPMEITYLGPYPYIDGMDVVAFKLPMVMPASCPVIQQPITLTVSGKTSNAVWLPLFAQPNSVP